METSAETPLSLLQKRTGQSANKVFQAAVATTTQAAAAAFLPQVEKEGAAPRISTRSNTGPPPGAPTLNGLSLNFPVMDFAAFRQSIDEDRETPRVVNQQATLPATNPPPASTRMDTGYEDADIDMTDWISDSPSSSPESSPTSRTPQMNPLFDFRIEADDGSQFDLDEREGPPVSPCKTTWNWTTGGIGIALKTPSELPDEGMWDM